MKREVPEVLLRVLSFDPEKLRQLNETEFLEARGALGAFGVHVEQIDEARRRYPPAGDKQ